MSDGSLTQDEINALLGAKEMKKMAEREAGYLTPEEAIRAMLDGEMLINNKGEYYLFDRYCGFFHEFNNSHNILYSFSSLRRKLQPQKRPMTRMECLAWATSEQAHGWVVRQKYCYAWCPPQLIPYDCNSIEDYQRARLLPDGSGIDEASICGFEVEE